MLPAHHISAAKHTTHGFSVVEVIVVSAIVVTMVAAIVVSLSTFFSLVRQTGDATQAAALLEEAAEGIVVLRDTSWSTHIESQSLETPYALTWNGSAYELGPEVVSGSYRRTITFAEALRDASDVIGESGTADPNTRRVTISIYANADNELLAEGEMLIHNTYDN